MSKRYGIPLALIALVVLIGVHIMPHGYPPWAGIKKQTVFSLPIDMAELAARMGSRVTHDRRGDVVFVDSFQDGLAPYRTAKLLADDFVVLSTLTSRGGASSCKLATSQGAGAYAEVRRYQPYPVLSSHGLEVSFTLDDDAVDVQIQLNLYDGSQRTDFQVKYIPASDKWQYYTTSGNWVDFLTGVKLGADYQFFHTAKLVVDFESDEYRYFLFDDTEESMAGISGRTIGSPTNAMLEAIVRLSGGAVATAAIYVDDVIITQNEP